MGLGVVCGRLGWCCCGCCGTMNEMKKLDIVSVHKDLTVMKNCCCCCSLRPIVDQFAQGIPRPPRYVLQPKGQAISWGDYVRHHQGDAFYSGPMRALSGGGLAAGADTAICGQAGHPYAYTCDPDRQQQLRSWAHLPPRASFCIVLPPPADAQETLKQTQKAYQALLAEVAANNPDLSPVQIRCWPSLGPTQLELMKAELAATERRFFYSLAHPYDLEKWLKKTGFSHRVHHISAVMSSLDLSQAQYDGLAASASLPDCPMPDPAELVRDLLLRNKFVSVKDANAESLDMNLVVPSLAALVAHELFRGNSVPSPEAKGLMMDHVNLASSTLDLQCLYGSSTDEMRSIREGQDGKLKPNAFCEDRLLRKENVQALLILFSKEHNHICDLLKKNYGSKFDSDDALFRQARQINISVFAQVVLHDYIGTIFGTPEFLKMEDLAPSPVDTPVHQSIEFSLIYRFDNLLPQLYEKADDQDPISLLFKDLKPGSDERVTEVLKFLLKTRSGAFGPRNVPAFLEVSQIKALGLSRKYGLAYFNDFRAHFKLGRYSSFEELNPDLEIVSCLKKHYGNINNVELYIGMAVEKYRSFKNSRFPGGSAEWGLPETLFACSRADVSASILYDRFHTHDFTEENLTPLGYKHSKQSILDLFKRHYPDVKVGKNFLECNEQVGTA
eukprot:Lithocolla_globosa_v1_NODE_1657_length_2415_cov_8.404661.p1 type:complete len:671 gc:universal NODE_1657_length_2415_cov_8.404661:354-2366(+)